ncbi:hypothetical protein RHGRI_030926 [Rhododendron griersonianum]|uniref:Aminotransferase-like plant mobile domain-containing protein n=1 Tax=Rhododendron griersonianum TaxID=479676 RepID=A0AAV6I9Q5_9ERIC|nr:hypothetical protein RHGRI_030926 [Rhododendron griersonianum]
MALFNDRSVDDNQVLSISYEGAAPATQVDLWVHDPAIGALALDWDLSPDSHHLSRWYTESSRELFDHGKSTFISNDALLLRSSLHKKNDDSEHFLLLGDRIANGDAKWGNTTPLFGEISFIDGYWDWLEDVLAWNKDVLSTAKIYDVVFASLFTYVRNTNLIRSFCELWCPSTNSLHVPIGEVSISLWDLRLIGGLSIDGIFYDEAMPSARELTGVDKKDVPLLPSSCKYLFLVYRKIYCASETSNVTTHDWVKFWFKETSRYKEPPLGFRRKGQFTCGARMARLGGEKKAKHFSSQEARDLLKNIMPSTLSLLALTKPKQGIVTDHGKHSDSWNDYIISLRSSYLTLRRVTQPLSKPKEKEVTKAVTKEAAVVVAVRPKTPLSIPASKPKPTVTNTSEPTSGRKRATVVLSEGSSSDQGERHWKRGKKKATDSDSQLKEKVTVSDLAKLDFNLHDVLDNLPDTSNHLELGNQFASDEREGSVDGPDPFDLALRSKHNFVSGAIHLPSTSKPLTLGHAAPSTVTAFDTGSVINRGRLLAAKIYDSNIKSILGKTPFEKLTSLRPKLQVIYAEFSKLELDYSPLQTQVEKYIQNATNYASMRSNFASGMTSEAKERRLADVDTKRGQLMEELEQLDLEAKRLRESLEGIDA